MAVIGDKDSVMLFKAVGIDVFYETDGEKANRQIKQLAREGYGVIYLTETLYPLCADAMLRMLQQEGLQQNELIQDQFGKYRFTKSIKE